MSQQGIPHGKFVAVLTYCAYKTSHFFYLKKTCCVLCVWSGSGGLLYPVGSVNLGGGQQQSKNYWRFPLWWSHLSLEAADKKKGFIFRFSKQADI